MFSYVTLEQRVPREHPLREIRKLTDEVLRSLSTEFDALYSEAGHRRRMMSVSAHDRIAGRPSRARVLEEFILYAQSHPGVVFMRKDEIARFALSEPSITREGI